MKLRSKFSFPHRSCDIHRKSCTLSMLLNFCVFFHFSSAFIFDIIETEMNESCVKCVKKGAGNSQLCYQTGYLTQNTAVRLKKHSPEATEVSCPFLSVQGKE